MPLKDCDTYGTSPYTDADNKSYVRGAWLRPMDNTLLPKDTAKTVYAVDFDIVFTPPYTVSDYLFGKSLPDNVTPYGIASLLKDFVISDIRIEAYDRRRKH